MRNWFLLVTLLALPLSTGLQATWAQETGDPDQVIYVSFRTFRIPFVRPNPEVSFDNLVEMRLYVSTDEGKSWQPSAVAAPKKKSFLCVCNRDGLHTFAVQTKDVKGNLFPERVADLKSNLKVMVDTLRPDVQLFSVPQKNGRVGVRWVIREENLDVTKRDAFVLEYKPERGANWLPLYARAGETGTHHWDPETNATLEVRLRVLDRAGNAGSDTTKLTPGRSVRKQYPPTEPTPQQPREKTPRGYSSNVRNRRLVNSKRIKLKYQLSDVGKSGVSEVQLWFTRDGESWNRYPLPNQSDGQNPTNPLVFEVNKEGVYGFTLLAKSGVGLSLQPPQIGDSPQLWVEVDLTKPIVELRDIVVGKGEDRGKITISWAAQDKNLTARPITLSYQADSNSEWFTFGKALANTGRYVWDISELKDLPVAFHVRIQAFDSAENVGEDRTQSKVKADLAIPKASILDVEGVGKGPGPP
ncbi:MAG: hypothetical protein ACFCD0_24910 [Gemmataceae bacterium]